MLVQGPSIFAWSGRARTTCRLSSISRETSLDVTLSKDDIIVLDWKYLLLWANSHGTMMPRELFCLTICESAVRRVTRGAPKWAKVLSVAPGVPFLTEVDQCIREEQYRGQVCLSSGMNLW